MGANTETLNRDLKSRHLAMLSVGGVIGAGFFLGAGSAINSAGPAVVVAYLLGGVITLIVMLLLAEMAVAMPVAGSFGTYSTLAFGRWAGFLTGWTYWLAFLIGPASETIAAGTFLNVWFPGVPIWVFCVAVSVLMTAVNVVGVYFFGEVEFWLSMVKVVAILLFIIGGATYLGTGHTGAPVNIQEVLTTSHGFAPNGWMAILPAMMMVIFAYGGTESIGTAAEESSNPAEDIPKTLRGTVLRILILYCLSITILLLVLPWHKAGLSSSPFVDAIQLMGSPLLANLMNFVVLTAALSCIDSGVYATSRMLFSMARDGHFPKVFTKLHAKNKTPYVAIISSSLMLFVGALVNILSPDAYAILASISGFGFLFSWLMIALSYPTIRNMAEKEGTRKFKVPGSRFLQPVAALLMVGILVGQAFFEGGGVVLLGGMAWLTFASIYYFAVARRNQAGALRPGESQEF